MPDFNLDFNQKKHSILSKKTKLTIYTLQENHEIETNFYIPK